MTDDLDVQLDQFDDEVKGQVQRTWPEVVQWVRRGEQIHHIAPGSDLSADDDAIGDLGFSYLASTSLGTGSAHLMATMRYLAQFGPTVTSMQSLLRTAIWGGAQAVWLLHPDDRSTRVRHAREVHAYAQGNRLKWLNTFDLDSLRGEEWASLSDDRRATASRLESLGKTSPDQTRIVREVAKLAFPGQTDAPPAVEQSWRRLGAIAHALPWELDTRRTMEVIGVEGLQHHKKVTARWAEVGGELSYAYAFLKLGWTLLDQRSTAPNAEPA
jgi:hypothetical protein